ncbi:hypothetical protein Vi05172_g3878 [Venturia inaequalis]|nr:hypothetical protein Vi05172_g3878 [Venturia inaequalis]
MKFISATALFSSLLATQAAPAWDAPPSLEARQKNEW